jgi:hypothetical protein
MSTSGSDYPGDQSRRAIRRVIILAACAVCGLGCIACCVAGAMAVMVVIQVLGSFAAALGQALASILIALLPLAAAILELLWLISTGQVVRFVVRLVQMLSAP